MAKYDNLHPEKARLLRRMDRAVSAYRKALKARDDWNRVPNKYGKMFEYSAKLEADLKKAGDAIDKAHDALMAWEVSDER